MASRCRITAGQVCDIEKVKEKLALVEDWIFVDIGFAPKDRSCGVAIGNQKAREVRFAQLVETVVNVVEKPGNPLNLLLEAPLSMAFTEDGNPWPRSFESKREEWNPVPKWFKDLITDDSKSWYYQAGPHTMAGAARLIWKLNRCKLRREVKLFEGFAPLKRTRHKAVAEKLRNVVKGETDCPVVPPDQITVAYPSRPSRKYTRLWPITGIEGWDSDKPPEHSSIPPVIWVPPKCYAKSKDYKLGGCLCVDLRSQAQ